MLDLLRIKNLALIQDVEIEFSSGLNVITGESGAGKSIILKALDFVLGEKLNSSIVRPNKEKASVEAVFSVENEEILIKREIIRESGRTRVYINDNLSTQTKLKQLREKLILYTSQHEQHKILKSDYHTHILDQYLPPNLLKQKQKVLEKIKELHDKKDKLEEKIRYLNSQEDFIKFQLQEIKKISPLPKEDDVLLEKRRILKNSVTLIEKIQQSLEILSSSEFSLLDNLSKLQSTLQDIVQIDSSFEETVTEVEHIKDILYDLEVKLSSYPIGVEELEELERIEARLWELEQLKKKLNKPLDEILEFQKKLEQTLSEKDNIVLTLKEVSKQESKLLQELRQIITQLNTNRKKISRTISNNLKNELLNLGFDKNIELYFDFFPKQIHAEITEEKAIIVWKPNPGQKPQPLNHIISGGELSRVFLGLISISIPEKMPTLIFDEVDTGIGGITLTKIGKKLKDLSLRHQVILITHWPQLASLADRHFKVHKQVINGETYTKCHLLKDKELREELTRMAGGGKQGKTIALQLLKEKR